MLRRLRFQCCWIILAARSISSNLLPAASFLAAEVSPRKFSFFLSRKFQCLVSVINLRTCRGGHIAWKRVYCYLFETFFDPSFIVSYWSSCGRYLHTNISVFKKWIELNEKMSDANELTITQQIQRPTLKLAPLSLSFTTFLLGGSDTVWRDDSIDTGYKRSMAGKSWDAACRHQGSFSTSPRFIHEARNVQDTFTIRPVPKNLRSTKQSQKLAISKEIETSQQFNPTKSHIRKSDKKRGSSFVFGGEKRFQPRYKGKSPGPGHYSAAKHKRWKTPTITSSSMNVAGFRYSIPLIPKKY